MIIKKDEVVKVRDSRKGTFFAKATEDFNTDECEFYPLVLWQDDPVQGLSTNWIKGESIPSRRGLSTIIRQGVKP